MSSSRIDPSKIINVNIGVLGHVDSGKTSLCKVLSTQASTAAFDKNPQSQERGITLDLGFSAFYVDVDRSLREHLACSSHTDTAASVALAETIEKIQYTLVDCPGHASLIRTIIGGAQIIDFMVLVIDAIKGVQTQTSECIIIGEITARSLIVVLNKVDLIPENLREQKVKTLKEKLIKNVFSATKFKNPPIIAVSTLEKIGIQELISQFNQTVSLRNGSTSPDSTFLFAIDHCFAIKGKGTVMTGTVLQGSVKVNQLIELGALKEQRKVKSIQMFKNPVNEAHMGDRIGVLVTNLDSTKIERGFASDPGVIKMVDTIIASVHKIRFYKREIKTKSKFHISVGHSTVMGVISLFTHSKPAFDESADYFYLDSLPEEDQKPLGYYFAKIDFETPIECYNQAKLIASKLDTDINLNVCRLAFHGTVISMFNKSDAKNLKVYKKKERLASIDRIVDDYNLIGKSLLKKKNARLDLFIGKNILVTTNNEEATASSSEDTSNSSSDKETILSHGIIESSFGSSGKFKVRLNEPLNIKNKKHLKDLSLKIKYCVNIYDKDRKWIQRED